MIFKNFKKVFYLFSLTILILGQIFSPSLIFAKEVLPNPTPQVTVSPSPQPTVIPNPTPTKSPTPSPTGNPLPSPVASPSSSLAKSPNLFPSPVSSTSPSPTPDKTASGSAIQQPSDWQVNPNGGSTTINNVVLNQVYTSPSNNKVTIKFDKLPNNSGKVTVKEIQTSTLFANNLRPLTPTAYDISSDMTNGTFEYTLTLPTPTTNNVEVKTSEDGKNFVTVGGVTATGDTLTITGLNHFTIFVLVNNINNNTPSNPTDDVANGKLSVIQDTYADQELPTTNFGSDSVLRVRSLSGNRNKRAFVKFDLSAVPASSTITKATLRLFMNVKPSISRTYSAHRITQNWSQTVLTWNNQPTTAATPSASIPTGTTPSIWLEWDVTGDVQNMVNGNFSNLGWMIRDGLENSPVFRQAAFRSSEYSEALNRPQLVVDFATTTQTNQYNSPTTQAATSGGRGNNGFEIHPEYAFADSGGVASNIHPGAGDRHIFYGYNFNIPVGSTINGIEVRADWFLNSTTRTNRTNSLGVELSFDGGNTWTTPKKDITDTIHEHIVSFGGAADTWGRTRVAKEFSNANFRVRVTADSTDDSRDFFLDWIPIRVYYSPDTTAPIISNVKLTNTSFSSNAYVKNGDKVVLTATVTDNNQSAITTSMIRANLSALGGGSSVNPASYNTIFGLATWSTLSATSSAETTVNVTVDAQDAAGNNANQGSTNIEVDNTVPVANTDSLATTKNTAIATSSATLTVNDTDLDNDILTVTPVNNPSHGTVNLSGSTITFTPEINFVGIGGFNYTISDGRNSATGHVTVKINPPVGENQVLLKPTTIVSAKNPKVVVGGENFDSLVNIPSDVNNATIDVSHLPITFSGSGKTKSVTLTNNIVVNAVTSLGIMKVQIPSGVQISGPVASWIGGLINAPTLLANSSVNVPPQSGFTTANSAVLEVGFGDVPLTLNKGVRIVLVGQTGKLVGYSRSGVFTSINNTCSSDTQVVGDSLNGGECKIDVGSDLIIWTQHFTKFVTYTQTQTAVTAHWP